MKYYSEESSITNFRHWNQETLETLETFRDFCRMARIPINLKITFFSAALGGRIISMLTNKDRL